MKDTDKARRALEHHVLRRTSTPHQGVMVSLLHNFLVERHFVYLWILQAGVIVSSNGNQTHWI
jgi:hypothetical protein